jgi:hypothetical protein
MLDQALTIIAEAADTRRRDRHCRRGRPR